MHKSSNIKSVFETIALRIQCGDSFRTSLGFKRIRDGVIKICPVGSRLYAVCFLALHESCPVGGLCLARSYPMSYKSAYRLVCSL